MADNGGLFSESGLGKLESVSTMIDTALYWGGVKSPEAHSVINYLMNTASGGSLMYGLGNAAADGVVGKYDGPLAGTVRNDIAIYAMSFIPRPVTSLLSLVLGEKSYTLEEGLGKAIRTIKENLLPEHEAANIPASQSRASTPPLTVSPDPEQGRSR